MRRTLTTAFFFMLTVLTMAALATLTAPQTTRGAVTVDAAARHSLQR